MADRISDRKKSVTKRVKKSKGNLAGILIISVVIILIVSIIYSFVSVSSNQIKRNKDNLCRVDGQYIANSSLKCNTYKKIRRMD
jgi:flagellar basal body-associated protein FliL